MFIAIIGTRCSGKTTIQDYLVNSKGFIPVRLLQGAASNLESGVDPATDSDSDLTMDGQVEDSTYMHGTRRMSFLSMGSSCQPSPHTSPLLCANTRSRQLYFTSAIQLLRHVTKNWQSHFVTSDICTRELIKVFDRRPFFMLINVDAPLLERFSRCKKSKSFEITLEEFVQAHDIIVFGRSESRTNVPTASSITSPLLVLDDLVNVHIANSFTSVTALYSHLDELNLLDPNHLRPNWDSYFMTLASLASQRSNCMKRRVGAILVREHRIVATGYNGTPRGVKNCNDGGCAQCNGTTPSGIELECLCLHAEENALLEAGRERIGHGAVLYCNTCPCLKCTIKIIQTGIKEVVYNLTYKVDEASGRLFKEAGVQLRQYNPNKRSHLPIYEQELMVSLYQDTYTRTV